MDELLLQGPFDTFDGSLVSYVGLTSYSEVQTGCHMHVHRTVDGRDCYARRPLREYQVEARPTDLPAFVALYDGLGKSACSAVPRRLLGKPNPASTRAPGTRGDAQTMLRALRRECPHSPFILPLI